MSIVTKDINGNDVLELFDIGITIDQKLPKWVNAGKRITEKKEQVNPVGPKSSNGAYRIVSRQTVYDSSTETMTTNMDTPFTIYTTPDGYENKETVNFDDVAAANLEELTELIKKGELNNILSGYGGMNGWMPTNNNWGSVSARITPIEGDGKTSFFGKLKMKIDKWLGKTFTPKPELDVIDFFTNVKLESKEGAEIYRDRVSSYLQAIHNANLVGQTALVEKFLSEMIANKYEALLASRGVYYAISEKRVIDFANKTERGVSLTYIKNFVRPIPQEAIDKVIEANGYEVFDNYVVMHYDPKNEQKAETKKEEAKRKDPIIFGVIAGSRKLYYITDWIDEHCDLTLEKFVDTLGTTKDEFAEGVDKKDEPVKEEPVKEEPKKELPKKPRKRTNKKKTEKKDE